MIKLVIDTREQNPWVFPGVRVIHVKLPFGDYAVAGQQRLRVVERKSPQDLVGSITTGWERFKREFDGATKAGTEILVVVDGSYADCEQHMQRFTPSRSFARTLCKFMDGAKTVPVFAGSRERAKALALAWLTAERKC